MCKYIVMLLASLIFVTPVYGESISDLFEPNYLESIEIKPYTDTPQVIPETSQDTMPSAISTPSDYGVDISNCTYLIVDNPYSVPLSYDVYFVDPTLESFKPALGTYSNTKSLYGFSYICKAKYRKDNKELVNTFGGGEITTVYQGYSATLYLNNLIATNDSQFYNAINPYKEDFIKEESESSIIPGLNKPSNGGVIDQDGFFSRLLEFVKSIFIPKEGFFENKLSTLKDTFYSKFPLIETFTSFINRISHYMEQSTDTPPKLELNFMGEKLSIIDFSILDTVVYSQNTNIPDHGANGSFNVTARDVLHSLILVFCYWKFFRKTLRRIPSLIGGV